MTNNTAIENLINDIVSQNDRNYTYNFTIKELLFESWCKSCHDLVGDCQCSNTQDLRLLCRSTYSRCSYCRHSLLPVCYCPNTSEEYFAHVVIIDHNQRSRIITDFVNTDSDFSDLDTLPQIPALANVSGDSEVVPQAGFMSMPDNIKEGLAFAREIIPDRPERDEWKDLLSGLNKELKTSRQTGEDMTHAMSFTVGQIQETVRKLTTILAMKLPDKSERTELVDVISDFNRSFAKATKNIDPARAIDLAEVTLKDAGKKFKSVAIKAALIAVIVSSIILSTQGNHTLTPVGILAVLFYGYNYADDVTGAIIGPIMNGLHYLFASGESEEPHVRPQSADNLLNLAATLISGLGAHKSKKSFTTEIYEKLNNFSKIKGGIAEISMGVVNIMEYFINLIRENIMDLPAIRLMKRNNYIVDLFLDKLDGVFELIRRGEYHLNVDNYCELLDLEKEGKAIIQTLPNNTSTRMLITYFEKSMDKLRTHVKRFADSNMNQKGPRVETTVVLLRGGPGCGKSIAMTHLGIALCSLNLNDAKYEQFLKDPEAFSFNRQSENKFWDGYTSNAVVVYIDDFGQARDVAGMPDNEFMNLIRIANGFETRLHMSDIKDKSNTFFRSPFMLMTSNMRKIVSDSVYSCEALNRRLTVNVLVTVKEKYCTEDTKDKDYWCRRIDPTKLNSIDIEGIPVKTLTYEVQEYYMMNTNDEVIGEVLTFEDIVYISQKAHEARRDWHKTHQVLFKETAAIYRKMYKPKSVDSIPQSGEIPKLVVQDLSNANSDDFNVKTIKSMYSKTISSIFQQDKSSYLGKLISFISDWKNWLKGFVVMLGLFLAHKAIKAMISTIMEALAPIVGLQSFSFGSKMAKTDKVNNKDAMNMLKGIRANKAQSGDKSGYEVMRSTMLKSIWTIEYQHTSGTYVKMGHGIGIVGHYILIPFHFIKELIYFTKEDENFLDSNVRCTLRDRAECILSVREFLVSQSYDSCSIFDSSIFKTPDDFPCSKDIRDRIATEKEHELLGHNIPYYLALSRDDNLMYTGVANKNKTTLKISSDRLERYEVNKTYHYKADTKPGDCGSPMFILNPRIQNKKIFGMHIAHNSSDTGFACSIYLELLEADIASFGEQDIILEDDIKIDTYIEEAQTQAGMLYHGNLNVFPTSSGKSTYKKSKLEGVFKDTVTAVSQLRPIIIDDVLIKPMTKAMNKYCTPRVYISRPLMNELSMELFNFMYQRQGTPVTPRLFSVEESIHGLEISPFFRSIKSSTSAGYPMNTRSSFNIKEAYFKNPDKYLPIINKEIMEYVNGMTKGRRYNWIYTDSLKVERRPIQKVKECSTRMFSGVPFYLLVLYRIYFGSFIEWFNSNAMEFNTSAGMNCYSGAWDQMYQILGRFDNSADISTIEVGAGDYAGFDGSEHAVVLQSILHLIDEFYMNSSVQDKRIRKILWLEVTNSIHINEGRIYSWSGSLTSGNPLTFIINCLVNQLAFRYVWRRVRRRKEDSFESFVTVFVGGDDNIFSVHRDYRDLFNEIELPAYLAEIGFKYTTEIKSTALSKFRNIQDVEFLKRTFRRCERTNKIIAPLRYDVILDIPLWTRTYDYDHSIVAENVVTALNELSLWTGINLPHSTVLEDYKNLIYTFHDMYPNIKTSSSLGIKPSDRKAIVANSTLVIPDM